MNEETQMMVEQSAGASSAKPSSNWQELPWSKIRAHVFQLQVRIAKAEREEKQNEKNTSYTACSSSKILR